MRCLRFRIRFDLCLSRLVEDNSVIADGAFTIVVFTLTTQQAHSLQTIQPVFTDTTTILGPVLQVYSTFSLYFGGVQCIQFHIFSQTNLLAFSNYLHKAPFSYVIEK